jgi:hypothetical protein
MSEPIAIQIIGAPIAACGADVTDIWRDLSAWVAGQLATRFGSAVRVTYFDLLDPTCPPLPLGAQLPLVLVNGEVLSTGGKISIPAIRKRIEALGVTPDGHRG